MAAGIRKVGRGMSEPSTGGSAPKRRGMSLADRAGLTAGLFTAVIVLLFVYVTFTALDINDWFLVAVAFTVAMLAGIAAGIPIRRATRKTRLGSLY